LRGLLSRRLRANRNGKLAEINEKRGVDDELKQRIRV
jgi:hypothetical protein